MTTEMIALSGKQQRVTISLVPLADAAKVVHRWPGWLPWAVFGGGLAVAGLRRPDQVQASARMDELRPPGEPQLLAGALRSERSDDARHQPTRQARSA